MADSHLKQKTDPLAALIRLVESLRGENGCPWDRKQTPQSIAVYLVEEVYELVEAIESGRPRDICEELGDVLFQIIFLARQFEEKGHFDIGKVAGLNTEKMIRRHPHVFGNNRIEDEHEVCAQWHQIKKNEKKHAPDESILDSVPSRMPALMRAYRISERAARTGFDWPDMDGVLRKAQEEWSEFKAELTPAPDTRKDNDRATMEFGDVLFTLVNVARLARIHPETALSAAVNKFKKRFEHMEKAAEASDRTLETLSHDEFQSMWDAAKKTESL